MNFNIETVTKIFSKKYYRNQIISVGIFILIVAVGRFFTSGVWGYDSVVKFIETEELDNFRQSNSKIITVLSNLEIKITDVTMSTPITSWSAREDVVARYSYQILLNNKVMDRVENKYTLITRKGMYNSYSSNAFNFYLNYVF